MKNNSQKTYWPHMILGFLFLAFTLSFWTVKTALSLPVQESNMFMMKYQQADINMNDILESKMIFDSKYTIEIQNVNMITMTDNIYSNRPQPDVIKLSKGTNNFRYIIKSKDGKIIKNAKVDFLLTQPHSRKEDVMLENISNVNGIYNTKAIEITKAGRYTLQLRVTIGDDTGYSELPAYLKP